MNESHPFRPEIGKHSCPICGADRGAAEAGCTGCGWRSRGRNDSPPTQTRRRSYRFKLQFRLRTLLLLTLALGLLSGWIGSRLQRARRNRQTAAEVVKVEQKVFHAVGESDVRYAERPDWLGRIFGDPGVLYVHGIGMRDGFDDAALEDLKGLTDLEVLVLGGTQVTDAGLVHVRGLTNLKRLALIDAQVTDAGLVHLKGLKRLEFLNLEGTEVTDQGVEKLRQALPNCVIVH